VIRNGCVVSVSGNQANVELEAFSCSRCQKGRGCAIQLLPSSQSTLSIDCCNNVAAAVGDRVEVSLSIPQGSALRVYSAYLFPLAGLLLGTLLGNLMGKQLAIQGQVLPSLGALFGFAGGLFAYPKDNCEQHGADLQSLNPQISRLLAGESTLATQQNRIRMIR
jgi:positive regulator of sigma E activity